jgi:hypothetical protein
VHLFLIQIGLMILSALLSYVLRPKPKDPEKPKASVAEVEDGKGIIDVFGTVWIDDPIILAWKDMGTIKIRAPKQGKKG